MGSRQLALKQVQTLYWLAEIHPSHRLMVGEKAFALSQLLQQGYPVLPGFVISAENLREFLDNLSSPTSLLADFPQSSLYVDIHNYKALQLLAQQSYQAIMETPLPAEWRSQLLTAAQNLKAPTLIFRPSIAAPTILPQALSGLLPSQLVYCQANAIEIALKQAWAKLFSAKSLFYWQRSGIKLEKIHFAVLVQPMANAIASGIATVQPHSLTIQSTWGLGHSLLQGAVIPDVYQIEPATARIVSQKLGNKTWAYRLRNLESGEKESNSLEAYLLSAREQKSYSLDEKPSLQQLISPMRRLSSEHNYRGCLEWTLIAVPDSPTPQVYLTQSILELRPQLLPQPSQPRDLPQEAITMATPSPLLTGLSASPGKAIALAYLITDADSPHTPQAEGKILITPTITPEWLPWLKQAAGLIVEQGGMTSHTAILARELGIPAIVGARQATALLATGNALLLQADKGEVYRLSHILESGDAMSDSPAPIADSLPSQAPLGTKLMVNLSQPSSLAKIVNLPVDGVGLLRSELMLLDLLTQKPLNQWLQANNQARLVEELAQLIEKFTKEFAPKPVFYRSFDGKAAEFSRSSSPETLNPPPQQRGTAGYLLDPSFFDLELEALARVQAAGCHNIHLILPFVRSIEEFRFCRLRVEKARLTQSEGFQLWIMAEVPSVIFLIPQYVEAGVQGIAIGTNDLTPLLLGIERQESESSETCHPALLAALQQLIQLAKIAQIPCSICGQAPIQDPNLINHLVRWGITAISVDPEAVSRTHQAIARAERRLLLDRAR